MFDVTKLMNDLARDRPVFHSEADFQHALAWHIHASGLDAGVRLEYRPERSKRKYVDLWLPKSRLAVELKYRTQKLTLESECECFDLRDQSARDIGRYDFLKDIRRLEKLSKLQCVQAGLAILLTNDPLYWKSAPNLKKTNDDEFRIHDHRNLRKKMAWSESAALGTTAGRRQAIRLKGSYVLQWQDYADLGNGENRQFRYLAVQIDTGSHEELREPC